LLLVMHGDAHAQGQGALALLDVVVAGAVRVVGGYAEAGVELVEGPLGLSLSFAGGVGVVVDPFAMVPLVGQVRVVVGPGPHLGVVAGQVGGGAALAPVVGVELQGLGGQLVIV
jgi:hypothetical protein